jgi:GTP pyrophosphokinase
MIVAMSKDIRVLIIKLADRLHNARTWGFVPPEKAAKKATETSRSTRRWRTGSASRRSRASSRTCPSRCCTRSSTPRSTASSSSARRSAKYVHNVIDAVESDLRDLRIRGRVMGRPKQLYSVYQKMVVRGREFDDIYDLIGIRVLVGTVRDCYAVLGSIHARWTPIPGASRTTSRRPSSTSTSRCTRR